MDFMPSMQSRYDVILEEYQNARTDLEQLCSTIASIPGSNAWSNFEIWFSSKNQHIPKLSEIKLEHGLKVLNSIFWTRLMKESRALEYVSNDKYREIVGQLTDYDVVPEFSEENIKPTMAGLFQDLPSLMADRVDGIFRALSGSHFTNKPEGFSSRMIFMIADVSFGIWFTRWEKVGYLDDLMKVVDILNDIEPTTQRDDAMRRVDYIQKNTPFGQWDALHDGIRIRLYKKGTAHVEISKDLAERLNAILAHKYPSAVPHKTKQRKKAAPKSSRRPVGLNNIQLGDGIIHELERGLDITDSYTLDFQIAPSKGLKPILELLNPVAQSRFVYRYNYPVANVVRDYLSKHRIVPDYKTHQFYPTPVHIATKTWELLDWNPGLSILEPSAGTGALVSQEMRPYTTAVEISPLFANILESYLDGFQCVRNGDFLKMTSLGKFDRVLMNPPFDGGRALDHLHKAWESLEYGGILVAILPMGLKDTTIFPGFDHEWCGVHTGFANTNVDITILKVRK